MLAIPIAIYVPWQISQRQFAREDRDRRIVSAVLADLLAIEFLTVESHAYFARDVIDAILSGEAETFGVKDGVSAASVLRFDVSTKIEASIQSLHLLVPDTAADIGGTLYSIATFNKWVDSFFGRLGLTGNDADKSDMVVTLEMIGYEAQRYSGELASLAQRLRRPQSGHL